MNTKLSLKSGTVVFRLSRLHLASLPLLFPLLLCLSPLLADLVDLSVVGSGMFRR
jgi:hypothetical protein